MRGAIRFRLSLISTSLLGKFRRNRSLQFGTGILLVFLAISLLDIFYPEYIGVSNAFNLLAFTNPTLQSTTIAEPQPPSASKGILYIFGTTAYKIPILPAIFAAIPVDFAFAFLIAGASAIIGVVVGVTSTYVSKKLEITISTLASSFISFPLLISVIIFGLMFNFTVLGIAVGIVAVLWAYYAQLSRMLTLNIKNNQYVEAARASGASGLRVVRSHIIPNIFDPIMVRFSMDLATVIVIFSAASFLFYHQFQEIATLPELGSLVTGFPALGLKYGYFSFSQVAITYQPDTATTLLLFGYWWTVLFPVIFLVGMILGLIIFSDGLRKATDPRTKM